MVRVLQIIGSLNMGGAENFIVNLYRNIDRSVIQFDFLLYDKPKKSGLYDEVVNLGAKIYYVSPKKEGIIKNYKEVKNIVRQNNYKIVWRHTSNCFAGIDIVATRAGGATRRILHSHSTGGNSLEKKLNYVCRPIVNMFVTERLACGNRAGKWLFGKRKFRVIANGINISKYKFMEETRRVKREELGIANKFVMGHVGRFGPEKNHNFIIDVFKEICSRNDGAVLCLIGEGALQERIYEKVRDFGLDKKVLFLNTRIDVPELMQAIDVFVMPSLFEGLPVSLIEAQATGLPCVVSDVITREVDVTGEIRFVSLDKSAKDWADIIGATSYVERTDAWKAVKAAGYDACDIALDIQEMLIKLQ